MVTPTSRFPKKTQILANYIHSVKARQCACSSLRTRASIPRKQSKWVWPSVPRLQGRPSRTISMEAPPQLSCFLGQQALGLFRRHKEETVVLPHRPTPPTAPPGAQGGGAVTRNSSGGHMWAGRPGCFHAWEQVEATGAGPGEAPDQSGVALQFHPRKTHTGVRLAPGHAEAGPSCPCQETREARLTAPPAPQKPHNRVSLTRLHAVLHQQPKCRVTKSAHTQTSPRGLGPRQCRVQHPLTGMGTQQGRVSPAGPEKQSPVESGD